MVAAAIVGAGIGGALLSSSATRSASSTAASAQSQAAQAGIDQQNKQFEAVQKLLSPYVQAGQPALTGQQDLLGLNGVGAQGNAINGIQSSPMFSAMAKQGEDSILANASATGGLRGGNVQGALAQFRPNLLASLIDQQYQRLGGMTQMGQNSAAGVGTAGMATGNNVAQLLQQQGAAQAGGALAAGASQAGIYNAIGNSVGMYSGLGGFGGAGPAYDATAVRAANSAGRSTGLGSSIGDIQLGQMPINTSALSLSGF